MSYIPTEVVDDVSRSTDIYQIVSRYVQLKRSGHTFRGLCPFHTEKTPSFHVTPSLGIYKCFGCGESGNSIKFLMKIEGWSFPETVRKLASEAGITIPEASPEEQKKAQKKRDAKELYTAVMSLAQKYFAESLHQRGGEAALFYLKERGIGPDVIQAFGLGYAPEGWDNLLNYMEKHGYSAKLLERAGLAIESNNESSHQTHRYYDRFRHRVIFPVVDIWGSPLAFGARRLNDDEKSAKYINSPETRFYVKGQQLYGLNVNKNEIQRSDRAILVEGNFDVLSLYAQGIRTAVAPMGTALTKEQCQLLARYTRNVFVAFDGDDAGCRAAIKAIGPLTNAGIQAKMVEFSSVDDPDTFIRHNGQAAFEQLLERAPNLTTWAIHRILPKSEMNVDSQQSIQALKEIAEVMQLVDIQSKFSPEVRLIAEKLGMSLETVMRYIRNPNHEHQSIERRLQEREKTFNSTQAEYSMLVLLVRNPALLKGFADAEYYYLFEDQAIGTLLNDLSRYYEVHIDDFKKGANGPFVPFYNHLEDEEKRDLLERATTDSDPNLMFKKGKEHEYFQDYLRTIKIQWTNRAIESIERDLPTGDSPEEIETWNKLVKQKEELYRYRESLKRRNS